MKYSKKLRLCSIPLMAVLLLAGSSVVQALDWTTAFQVSSSNNNNNNNNNNNKKKKNKMPEGNATIILAVSAGAVGVALYLRRRRSREGVA